MVPYLLLIILSVILIFIRNNHIYMNYVYRYIIIFNMSLILFILYVLRSIYVGSDYKQYYSFFSSFTYNQLVSNFVEPGYAFLNKIAQSYNNFFIISVVIFIIVLFGLFLLCKILNVNEFLMLSFFILTYFYLFMTNGIRQFLALGIICLGLWFFFKFYNHLVIKYILFILFIIIAKQFHSTAPFCLMFLILPFIHYGKKTVVITGVMTTLLFFTNVMNIIFNKLLGYSSFYEAKYNMSGQSSGGTNVIGALGSEGFIKFLPTIIQFIFLYIFINNIQIKGYKLNFILSGYLIFLFMNSASGNIIAERLQIYLYIFPILFSSVFLIYIHMKNKVNTNISKIMLVSFWIIYNIIKLLTNAATVVPYKFI